MAGEGRVIKLQTPEYVYFGGRIRPWPEAVLHISTEAVTRGLNVFEGLKGYWQPDGGFGLVALRRHYERLRRSARLLHLPFGMEFEAFEHACHGLVQALYEPAQDMWVRATLYGVEGHWGEGTVADLVLTAYHQPRAAAPAPLDVGVSTWRRAADAALPCRIKTSTNYQVARLARIEGRARGCGEMILLNGAGRVAEATGSCVLVVRDGRVITPPAWEGALESITVDIAAALCGSLGIPFERRPVDRTELAIADELALAGTLVEIRPVRALDGRALPAAAPIVTALPRRYRAAATGAEPHPAVDRSCRPYAAHARIIAAE
jgi:branched-chain amino acid aminotransferase